MNSPESPGILFTKMPKFDGIAGRLTGPETDVAQAEARSNNATVTGDTRANPRKFLTRMTASFAKFFMTSFHDKREEGSIQIIVKRFSNWENSDKVIKSRQYSVSVNHAVIAVGVHDGRAALGKIIRHGELRLYCLAVSSLPPENDPSTSLPPTHSIVTLMGVF